MLCKITVKVMQRTSCLERWSYEGDEIAIHVSVKEKAENDKANCAVIEILSKVLNVGKNKLKIVRGKRAKSKLLHVDADRDYVINILLNELL